jgi:hypothetical protein
MRRPAGKRDAGTRLKKTAARALLQVYDKHLRRRYEPYLAHFRAVVGYDPSIARPRRYHEKMLWRKLFDHSPRIALFCDKLATRDFIRQRAPELALPDLLWVGDSPGAIPDAILSAPAVFKCNHGCDYNYFWKPGESDADELKARLAGWLRSVYGQTNYEWGYTTVRPKIMAERLLVGPSPGGLLDINVRVAWGRALFCSVIADNKTPRKALGYYDVEGRRLHFASGQTKATAPGPDDYAELPDGVLPARVLREAAEIGALLGRTEDYARFDFLYDGNKLYGGEVTVYPASGLSPCTPEGGTGPDTMVNEAWDLRRSWFLSTPQRGWAALYAAALKAALD